MPMVNFSVPTVLERRINKTIKEKGFASKAEFFRYAALNLVGSGSVGLSLAQMRGRLQKVGKRITQKDIDQAVKNVHAK